MAASTDTNELVDRLGGVPLFCETSKKQRRVLAKLGKVVTWKAGRVAIRQGSTGAAFFLILEGAVDVVRDGTTVARLHEGDFVGEIAMIDGTPRNADVVAVTDTRVYALGRPGLAAALQTEPAMCLALLKAMAARRTATA